MTDEGRHEQVLDTLMGLQARLRGDPATHRPATPPRAAEPEPTEPSDEIEGIPPLRLAPEPVEVREGDVAVVEGEGPSSADRLAALSERLQRVERELSHAMERLGTAEARYVGDEDMSEPEPRGPDRDLYHQVLELQDLASKREHRRRR
jgi:hypothetical protein